MTPRRAFFAMTALVAISVAAGVAAARLLPVESQEQPAGQIAAAEPMPAPAPQPVEPVDASPPTLRKNTFGGLVYAPLYAPFRAAREAPQAEPVAPAEVPETPTTAPVTSIPLPPARPPELASLAPDIPAPPVRPSELTAPVVVASLTPMAPAATPETKPQLVEPTPMAAENPPAADVPFKKGQPAYVRIFKQEGELELWLKKGGKYALYKSYPICKWSGHLGPKLKEADYQSPEGFYSVSARQLNPNSHYHRAFNVGFPNALEKQLGYTGGLVMVHGDCKSVGCFAMTDHGIEEIYDFVAAAIGAGQREVPVNIFPFRMTDSKLARETGGGWLSFAPAENARWASFWSNLKEGFDRFEQTGEPPTAFACGGRYAFSDGGASCKRIAGW